MLVCNPTRDADTENSADAMELWFAIVCCDLFMKTVQIPGNYSFVQRFIDENSADSMELWFVCCDLLTETVQIPWNYGLCAVIY